MYICGQIGRRVPAVRLITKIGSKEEIKMSNAYPKKATTSGEVKISENVIRSNKSNTIFVVDCDIRINTPELRQGGTRVLSNEVILK